MASDVDIFSTTMQPPHNLLKTHRAWYGAGEWSVVGGQLSVSMWVRPGKAAAGDRLLLAKQAPDRTDGTYAWSVWLPGPNSGQFKVRAEGAGRPTHHFFSPHSSSYCCVYVKLPCDPHWIQNFHLGITKLVLVFLSILGIKREFPWPMNT